MKYLLVFSCAVLCGCGQLFFPALQRLSPEEQANVDQMWNNMLAPANRLDRELLLDTLEAFQLHTTGIDRMKVECEKDFNGGTVHMVIDFNRKRAPEDDRFVIMIRDQKGQLLRKETYSSEEVLSHGRRLFGPSLTEASGNISITIGNPTTQPTSKRESDQATPTASSTQELTEAQKADEAWLEARSRQIQAATQPAEVPTHPRNK